jgi:hypothetical protein
MHCWRGVYVVYVVHPNTANLSLEEIGIKAAALGHMERIGLPVPPFRVLSAGFFEKHASDIGLAEKIDFLKDEIKDYNEIGKHLHKIINDSKLSEPLVEEIAKAVEQIRGSTIERMDQSMSYAVRISKSYLSSQDSKIRLHLQGLKEVESAIISSFADHFSEGAIEERISKGIDALSMKIPLILQQFIKPDVTGIIMTMSKEMPDHYYIVAWKGFGFEMNFHFCDHYVVSHKDLVLKRFLNNKTGEVMFFDEAKNSITRTKIIHSEASLPFLSHNDIVGLCEIYSSHKDNLGGLGLEFKIRKNRIVMISLKDESCLDKAKGALEDLKEMASRQDAVQEPGLPEEDSPSDEVVEAAIEEEPSNEYSENSIFMDEDMERDEVIIEHDNEPFHPLQNEMNSNEHHKSLSEEVSDSVMHHMTIEASSDDALIIDDDDISEDSDRDIMAHIDAVCEKYIAINPSLEKVIRMLQDDIKSSINNRGSR